MAVLRSCSGARLPAPSANRSYTRVSRNWQACRLQPVVNTTGSRSLLLENGRSCLATTLVRISPLFARLELAHTHSRLAYCHRLAGISGQRMLSGWHNHSGFDCTQQPKLHFRAVAWDMSCHCDRLLLHHLQHDPGITPTGYWYAKHLLIHLD
jgi:hypothetical protein